MRLSSLVQAQNLQYYNVRIYKYEIASTNMQNELASLFEKAFHSWLENRLFWPYAKTNG